MRHKCLFFSPGFPPPFIGGSLVYYYYLLSKCKEDDLVVVTRRKINSDEIDSQTPYPIHRTQWIPDPGDSRLKRLICYMLLLPMLVIWIIKYRVSVLHLGALPDIIPGWLTSRITGCSLVVTIMGEDLTTKPVGNSSLFFRWLRFIHFKAAVAALRRTECVQTIATFGKTVLLQIGVPENRIAIITPGIDIAKTTSEIKIDPVIASRLKGKRVLLTVGRLLPRKGQDMVIRALPQLIGQYPDLRYVMVGCGYPPKRKEYCEQLARELGVQDFVLALDDLDNASVAWLYHACEVFIMANRTMPDGNTEGYGIVFLEAGAWGKPVIGGRAGGAVDAVDEGVTGLLVDGANVEDIEHAIIKLLSDRELATRMGEAGRQKASRNGWDLKATQYLEMLARLIGESSKKQILIR